MTHLTRHQLRRIQDLMTLRKREEVSLLSEYAPDCATIAEVDRAIGWHIIDELTQEPEEEPRHDVR